MNLFIKNKAQFWLCLLFCCITIASFAQENDYNYYCKTIILKNDLLSVKQMKKDLFYYYKTILDVHPNPYQVLSPEQLDIKIQNLLRSIDKPLNRVDFFLKIGVLNSCFDYHTQIFGYECAWQIYRTFFPPNFISMKDGVFCFVNNSYLDSSLWDAKINTINYISCDKLTDLAKSYVSFENHHRISFTSNTFFMQYLLHEDQDTVVLEYEKNNQKGSIKYNLDDCIKLWELAAKEENKEDGLKKYEYPFDYKIFKNDAIAVLELNSFMEEKIDQQKYSIFLSHFFDTINFLGIKHLFIDISANGGGNDNFGFEVLKYLIKDSTYYLGKVIYKTSKERRKYLRKYDKEMYYDYLKLSKNKKFFFIGFFLDKKSDESTSRYKHNVYLIQSGETASAASSVINFVKDYKIGYTIGSETSDGINLYGNVLYFKMKYSKLRFSCASSYSEDIAVENQDMKRRVQADIVYPIRNPYNSFTIEQLKEMLQLIDAYEKQKMLRN